MVGQEKDGFQWQEGDDEEKPGPVRVVKRKFHLIRGGLGGMGDSASGDEGSHLPGQEGGKQWCQGWFLMVGVGLNFTIRFEGLDTCLMEGG